MRIFLSRYQFSTKEITQGAIDSMLLAGPPPLGGMPGWAILWLGAKLPASLPNPSST
jgi:hypothetical protein